jgi:hypothetical protein
MSVPVYAKESVTFSPNEESLTYRGDTYLRLDEIFLFEVSYSELDAEVELSAHQAELIDRVTLETNLHENIIYARIYYADGTITAAEYLAEEYYDFYLDVVEEDLDYYYVDFEIPSGNIVEVDVTKNLGESITLTGYDIMDCTSYLVYSSSEDGLLNAITGAVIDFGFDYYYVNFNDMKVLIRQSFDPTQQSALTMKEIVDKEVLEQVKSGIRTYNAYIDDYGYHDVYDYDYEYQAETAYSVFSIIFLSIIFGLIPLAVFIVFLILAIRAKGTYRKIFTVIYILAAAGLFLFLLLLVTFSLFQSSGSQLTFL